MEPRGAPGLQVVVLGHPCSVLSGSRGRLLVGQAGRWLPGSWDGAAGLSWSPGACGRACSQQCFVLGCCRPVCLGTGACRAPGVLHQPPPRSQPPPFSSSLLFNTEPQKSVAWSTAAPLAEFTFARGAGEDGAARHVVLPAVPPDASMHAPCTLRVCSVRAARALPCLQAPAWLRLLF